MITKEIFGQIRRIYPFRLTGNKKDYIVVGSDSGRIVILEADLEKKEFIKIHMETFGKTGCRRIVPGDYIAADPKGRAIMIGAIEKQKFVYLTSRDTENKMTISSPLEAHKQHTLLFDIVGLDVGYENPLFACLEVDYGDSDNEMSPVNQGDYDKLLVFYEMDLGLNHVVRKSFEIVDKTAHLLISVPGTTDGPGGVIVCCENYIIYKKANHEDRITPIPLRHELQGERGVMLISYTLHKKKNGLFFLAQSEYGDIYKISMQYTGEDVHGVLIQYYDTIPVGTSICMIPSYLFCASETANHILYNIQSLGDENEVVNCYSTMDIKENYRFNPRKLKNIIQCDEIYSLSCITDMMVEDLTNEGTPQIYSLVGKSSRSSLRVLKHGLSVNEMASSDLPGKPLAIWSLKGAITDKLDKYIVVSFSNQSLVLGIGEKVVEITNSGFDTKKPSLHVGLLEDNTHIQIFPGGIIHIKADKKKTLHQTSSKILAATSNQRQIALALQDKEIIYFELEEDKLSQIEKKVLDSEILSIDIGPIPEGRPRCKFLVVGCADGSVRILSLDIEQCLSKISMQMLPSAPESVSLLEMGGLSEEKELFIFVGLKNGVLMKTAVDNITGGLSDTRTKYLGSRSVNLFKANIQGSPALLANSTKPWLCYNFMSKYYSTNLNYESIDYASSFSSEICSEGIVAIAGNSLKIFSVERLGEIFNQTIIPLRYTPRRMVVHPETNNIVIIEADQNVLSKREKDIFKKEISDKTTDEEYLKLKEDQIGVPYVGEGRWGSCIRMIDPNEHKLLDLIEFEENEAAFSCCVMTFLNTPGEMFLIVGTAKDLRLHPRSCTSSSIIVFAFKEQGKKIEFLHRVSN